MPRLLSASSRLKDFKARYIGEYDESDEYIYTNDRYLIPNFVRKMVGMKCIRPDRRVRRYGRIKAHLFYYITTPMLFITAAIIYVVVQNFFTLLGFFETNIYLNGIIVSLMIFGILRIYYNSFLIFRASSFLRQVERTVAKPHVTSRDVENLRVALETKGELFNTYSMSEVLDNLEEFGYFNITDNQARFIKSKLGYRVSANRKGVNFIGGILVMLGLLGTFLGLLGTIDAVGEALNSMSSLGGGGDIGTEEMALFIGSLAAPLQGMGLAFSTSLYGLSGSLLIGFFLHLASTPQNYFIENVSRWIDDRIQKFDPKKLAAKAKAVEGKKGEPKPVPQVHATDKDLKDWLTGYVYLTNETNKKLADLTHSIAQAGGSIDDVTQGLRVVSGGQDSLLQSSQSIEHKFEELIGCTQQIVVSAKDVQDLSHMINTAMTSVDLSNKQIASSLPDVTSALGAMDENNRKYTGALYKELNMLNEMNAEAFKIHSQDRPVLDSIGNSLETMNKQAIDIARNDHVETKETQGILQKIEVLLNHSNQELLKRGASQDRLQNIEKLLMNIEQTNRDLTRAVKSSKGGPRFSFFGGRKKESAEDRSDV